MFRLQRLNSVLVQSAFIYRNATRPGLPTSCHHHRFFMPLVLPSILCFVLEAGIGMNLTSQLLHSPPHAAGVLSQLQAFLLNRVNRCCVITRAPVRDSCLHTVTGL